MSPVRLRLIHRLQNYKSIHTFVVSQSVSYSLQTIQDILSQSQFMDIFQEYLNISGLIVLIIGTLILICKHCTGIKVILDFLSNYLSNSRGPTEAISLAARSHQFVDRQVRPVRSLLEKVTRPNLPSGSVTTVTTV